MHCFWVYVTYSLSSPLCEWIILHATTLVIHLWVHHITKDGKNAYFYTWTESDAKHRTNEVFSCLWDFVKKKVGKSCDTFLLFRDVCGSQVRNHTVTHFLQILVNQERFRAVYHYYSTWGQSRFLIVRKH